MNKKTLIIGGSVLGLIAIGYFVFRKKKTATNDVGTSNDVIVEDEPSSDTPSKNDTPPKKNSTPVKQNTPTNNADAKKIQSLKAYIDNYALPKKFSTYNDLKKQVLNNSSLDFLQKWADAIKLRISSKGKNGTMFSYRRKDSQITSFYNSYYGTEEFNAKNLNKRVFATEDTYAFDKPEKSGYLTRITIKKGKEIGVVKGVYFNIDDARPFLYIPDTKVNLSLTDQIDLTNRYKWVFYGNNVTFK